RSLLSRACSITRRTSLTPADMADNSTNLRSGAWEITWARVVLPVPGGPYSMIEEGPTPAGPFASVSFRNGEPGVNKCCWPTISSRVLGRIRTAKGAAADTLGEESGRSLSSCAEENKSCTSPTLMIRPPGQHHSYT